MTSPVPDTEHNTQADLDAAYNRGWNAALEKAASLAALIALALLGVAIVGWAGR